MKKILAMLLVIVMVIGLVACGNKETKPTTPTATEAPVETTEAPVEETTEAPTEDVVETEPDVDETEPEEVELTDAQKLLSVLMTRNPVEFEFMNEVVDIEDLDMLKFYTGLDNNEKILSATYVEPWIRSQAFSIVIVELKDEADGEEIATAMAAGIDQRKWICVSADDMTTAVAGRYVILAMMAEDMDDINSKMVCDNFVDMMANEAGALMEYELIRLQSAIVAEVQLAVNDPIAESMPMELEWNGTEPAHEEEEIHNEEPEPASMETVEETVAE